ARNLPRADRVVIWEGFLCKCGITLHFTGLHLVMNKWMAIVVLVAVGGFIAYRQVPAWKTATAAEGGARPKTALVEERDIRFSVPAAGEISPAEQVSVKPEINGRVETLPVDIGDEVKQGQVL